MNKTNNQISSKIVRLKRDHDLLFHTSYICHNIIFFIFIDDLSGATPISQSEIHAADMVEAELPPPPNMTDNFRSYMGHLSELHHDQDVMDMYSSEDSDTGEKSWVGQRPCRHTTTTRQPVIRENCNLNRIEPLISPTSSEDTNEGSTTMYDSLNPYSLFNLPTPSSLRRNQHYRNNQSVSNGNHSYHHHAPNNRPPHHAVPFHQRDPLQSDHYHDSNDSALINHLYPGNNSRYSAYHQDLPSINDSADRCSVIQPFVNPNGPMCRPCARKPWQQHDPNQQVSGLDLSSESSRNRVLNEQNQVQTTPSSSTGANSELLMDLDEGEGHSQGHPLYGMPGSAFRHYKQMKDRSQLQGGNNSSNEDSNSLSSNDRNSDLVQELFGFRGQGDDLGTMSPVVPEVNLSSGSEDSDVEVLHIETNR